jgi:hypothetical protein
VSKTISELFREVILLNELGGDMNAALCFSDPDGVRSGKSGWSFGVAQFDTQNNDRAIACLKECGFTDAEIKGIVNQTIDVKPLAKRLQDHAGIIVDYDQQQLQHCINAATKFASDYNIPVGETAALLSMADTVNQYGSLGPATAKRLQDLGRPITLDDITTIKLSWKYGQTHPKDVKRRQENIRKVCEAAV